MRDTFIVSFDEASFSDHAVLSWSLDLQGVSLDPLSPPKLPKAQFKQWQWAVLPLLNDIFSMPQGNCQEVDLKVEALHEACQQAHESFKSSHPHRGVSHASWWNEECAEHIRSIRVAHGWEKDFLLPSS